MNTHTPRAQQHRQVQSLAVLAMFTAILFLLTFTPIGMIKISTDIWNVRTESIILS